MPARNSLPIDLRDWPDGRHRVSIPEAISISAALLRRSCCLLLAWLCLALPSHAAGFEDTLAQRLLACQPVTCSTSCAISAMAGAITH